MKKVIISPPDMHKIDLDEVNFDRPVFVRKNNGFIGMLIYNNGYWEVAIGRAYTLPEFVDSSILNLCTTLIENGYELYVED